MLNRTLAVALWVFALVVAPLAVAGTGVAGVPASPAARLAAAYPDLFPPSTVADAAAAGELGVRIVVASPALGTIGFRVDDVILAADGQRLGSDDWRGDAASAGTSATWTVWRNVAGQRPVLTPAILGRRTLEEFVVLPPTERTAMRLAVMLANHATLVNAGAGVLLVSGAGTSGTDDAAWIRFANPLPGGSEAALIEVAQATEQRVLIGPAPQGELAAAQERLAHNDYIEAEERSRRALLQIVRDPGRRASDADFDTAVTTYIAAQTGAARVRAELLAPEPRLSVILEGQAGRIQAFLPQETLLQTSNSGNWAGAIGVRVGAPVSLGSELSLLFEYGQIRNTFDGPDGNAVFRTTLHKVTGEVMYRPRVASRLKPNLRLGAGAFPISARIVRDGVEHTAFERTNLGFVAGGGIDVLRIPSRHFRVTVNGAYRLLKYKLLPASAPNIEIWRIPHPFLVLNGPRYTFDMDGWNAGLALEIDL